MSTKRTFSAPCLPTLALRLPALVFRLPHFHCARHNPSDLSSLLLSHQAYHIKPIASSLSGQGSLTKRSSLVDLEDAPSTSLSCHRVPCWQASSRIRSIDEVSVTSLLPLHHSGGRVKSDAIIRQGSSAEPSRRHSNWIFALSLSSSLANLKPDTLNGRDLR